MVEGTRSRSSSCSALAATCSILHRWSRSTAPPRRAKTAEPYERRNVCGVAEPGASGVSALSHPDRDARAAGQAPAISWIEDENTVYARLGQASPSAEATLVDPDDLLEGRRARLGDPEKSTRDYRTALRTATDHASPEPHERSRLSNSWSHECECDPGRAPSRRRRRSGRGRAQEEDKDASDRDGNAEPHDSTYVGPNGELHPVRA